MRATEGERRAAVAISAFGCHWRASAERTVDCSCGEVVASEIDAATVDIHDILVLRIELGRDAGSGGMRWCITLHGHALLRREFAATELPAEQLGAIARTRKHAEIAALHIASHSTVVDARLFKSAKGDRCHLGERASGLVHTQQHQWGGAHIQGEVADYEVAGMVGLHIVARIVRHGGFVAQRHTLDAFACVGTIEIEVGRSCGRCALTARHIDGVAHHREATVELTLVLKGDIAIFALHRTHPLVGESVAVHGIVGVGVDVLLHHIARLKFADWRLGDGEAAHLRSLVGIVFA